MIKNQPLTKIDLIKTLKEVGVATKGDVRQIVSEEINQRKLATKNDLKGLATKNDLIVTKSDLKNEIVKSERRLVRRIGQVEKGLRNSIANLAETTPTRKEFSELKQQVQGYYSPN